MVRITETAERQRAEMIEFWLSVTPDKPVPYVDAAIAFQQAYDAAVAKIDARPGIGTPYLSPYRDDERINRLGYRWIKVHRYWFAHVVGPDGMPILTGVHLESEQLDQNVSPDREPIGEA